MCRVSSLSLVRYRNNDYSVPVAYGHRDVLVRGYVHEVVISLGALDQAAPLAGWELPEHFDTLRRLMESRMDKRGKREYVQVLRLMETFS